MMNDADYYVTIKDLPEGERPRERLQHFGAGALSTAELLAIILRTGVRGQSTVSLATRLLAENNGLAGLARASLADLCAVKGLGIAKSAQIQAAFELGRRLSVAAPHEKPKISSPADASNLVMLDMSRLEQEQLRVLLLDTRNRVLASPTVYQGSLNSSLVRVAELFRDAIRNSCAAIIIIHNHPSGDPTPSPEDVALTRQVVEAGKLLNIDVLDHIVIGQQRFVSLKERGLGFS